MRDQANATEGAARIPKKKALGCRAPLALALALAHLALAELLLQQLLVLEEVLGDDARLETRFELLQFPPVLLEPLQVFVEVDAVPLAVPKVEVDVRRREV